MEHEEADAPPYTAEDGGYTGEEQVMSEVHLGCPPNHSGPHISHFTISLPPQLCNSVGDELIEDSSDSTRGKVYEVDEDGDLILTRRRNRPKDSFVISIQHNITSSIPRVGLQVWRAELVLADLVLHMTYKSSDFDGIVAIELGAGTGLVGMFLARVANAVFITDKGDEVLGNCAKNIHLNAGIFQHKASIYVRELDWNRPWPPEVVVKSPSEQSYGWSISEVEELHRASLLLAADVIYSEDLTDAFFSVLEVIMSNSPEKVLYLALEKRYNFTIDDLDVVANGYSHFRSYIKDEEGKNFIILQMPSFLLNRNSYFISTLQMHEGEDDALETESPRSFVGSRINLERIPQYVQEYDRGNDVEIWQIRYVKTKP